MLLQASHVGYANGSCYLRSAKEIRNAPRRPTDKPLKESAIFRRTLGAESIGLEKIAPQPLYLALSGSYEGHGSVPKPSESAALGTIPNRHRESSNTQIGGEGGIRTHEGRLTLTPLAGERLQPLGHLSARLESAGTLWFFDRGRKPQNAVQRRTAREHAAKAAHSRHRSVSVPFSFRERLPDTRQTKPRRQVGWQNRRKVA